MLFSAKSATQRSLRFQVLRLKGEFTGSPQRRLRRNSEILIIVVLQNRLSQKAGVAKLVYAPDSKSGEVHSSCRFESDLRHQLFDFRIDHPVSSDCVQASPRFSYPANSG